MRDDLTLNIYCSLLFSKSRAPTVQYAATGCEHSWWSCGCGYCPDYGCLCDWISDATEMATVAVLWLLFSAPNNITQESIVKLNRIWTCSHPIRYDGCYQYATRVHTVASTQCLSTMRAHTVDVTPIINGFAAIRTKAQPQSHQQHQPKLRHNNS